jgi:hypothetical protein
VRRAIRRAAGLELATIGAVIAVALLAFVPAYLNTVSARDTLRCHATQRRVQTALDAYEADAARGLARGAPVPGRAADTSGPGSAPRRAAPVLAPDLAPLLLWLTREGYLAAMPSDLAGGSGPVPARFGRSVSGTVFCRVHGAPPPPAPPAPALPPAPPAPSADAGTAGPRRSGRGSGSPTVRRLPGFWR